MLRDPSEDPDRCLFCHAQPVGELNAVDPVGYKASLHLNLWGERAQVELRTDCELPTDTLNTDNQCAAGFQNRCSGCHTTCGQCHVSRPKSVGGGFPKTFAYLSHRFRKTPHMTEQCTACHGSRVGTDYLGQLDSNEPDTHYERGMQCSACHSAQEMHGDTQFEGAHYDHRYQVKTMPRCEGCHEDLAPNDFHAAHVGVAGRNLQCQVCHSQPYKNCTNCHALTPEGYEIDPSTVGFKIAHNPRRDTRGEYDYVVVRHVPVHPDSFAAWDVEATSYGAEPTWKYASPHNVRRWTAQTTVPDGGACAASCHGAAGGAEGIFLREADLFGPDGQTPLPDYGANLPIIMTD